MTTFIWGDSCEVPEWIRKYTRDLSTETHAPPHAFDSEGDSDEIPDPTEWVQVSRRYRYVRHVTTDELRGLSHLAWLKFRERGGAPARQSLDYVFKLASISSNNSKNNASGLKRCQTGWDFGYHGSPLPAYMSSHRVVTREVGTFAGLGMFFRSFFGEPR